MIFLNTLNRPPVFKPRSLGLQSCYSLLLFSPLYHYSHYIFLFLLFLVVWSLLLERQSFLKSGFTEMKLLLRFFVLIGETSDGNVVWLHEWRPDCLPIKLELILFCWWESLEVLEAALQRVRWVHHLSQLFPWDLLLKTNAWSIPSRCGHYTSTVNNSWIETTAISASKTEAARLVRFLCDNLHFCKLCRLRTKLHRSHQHPRGLRISDYIFINHNWASTFPLNVLCFCPVNWASQRYLRSNVGRSSHVSEGCFRINIVNLWLIQPSVRENLFRNKTVCFIEDWVRMTLLGHWIIPRLILPWSWLEFPELHDPLQFYHL